MSKAHKDLPAGSQQWASEVDKAMAKIRELEAVIRRLTENAGIDMSNPKRGINTGDTPNVGSPVGQKVSSLADVDSYNVLEGQVLSWSQQGQKWLPVTLPSASGAIDIPMKYIFDQPLTGYGQLFPDTNTWAYTGTTPTGQLEMWATDTAYLASGNHELGPVALIELAKDNFNRPYVQISAEDYEDATYSSVTVYSYGVRVNAPRVIGPTTSTAGRPTGLGSGTNDVGSHTYDYDLDIPIWWNGTAWKNALGTTV